MKQHITTEQINELDDMTKVKLRYSLTRGEKWQKYTWDDISKMLTIGKMMGILEDKRDDEIFITRCEDYKWNVCFGYEPTEEYADNGYEFERKTNELVDALWEAVKYILKEGKS